jgi:hypothetical protein
MAMNYGTSDAGASRWAAGLRTTASDYSRQGMGYALETIRQGERDEQRLLDGLAHLRSYQAEKKAAAAEDEMSFSSMGALAGLAMAPYTGGLNLGVIGRNVGFGGAIGGVLDSATGRGSGANVGRGIADFAAARTMPNPLYDPTATPGATVQKTVDRVTAGPQVGGVPAAGAKPQQQPRWQEYLKDAEQYAPQTRR